MRGIFPQQACLALLAVAPQAMADEPPREERAQSVRVAASVSQVGVPGGRSVAAGVALVLVEGAASGVDLALLAQWEGTRRPFQATFEPAAAFAGFGLEATAPFALGLFQVRPGLRASLGLLESIGPPDPASGPIPRWLSHAPALLLSPTLQLRWPFGRAALWFGAGFRLQLGDSAANLTGPTVTAGVEVPSYAVGGVTERRWAMRLDVERVQGAWQGFGVRLGPEWSWTHARFALGLAARLPRGEAAACSFCQLSHPRSELGLGAGLRFLALDGARVVRPFVGVGAEVTASSFYGDGNVDLTVAPSARAGLEVRPGSSFEFAIWAGVERVEGDRSATDASFRIGIGIGVGP